MYIAMLCTILAIGLAVWSCSTTFRLINSWAVSLLIMALLMLFCSIGWESFRAILILSGKPYAENPMVVFNGENKKDKDKKWSGNRKYGAAFLYLAIPGLFFVSLKLGGVLGGLNWLFYIGITLFVLATVFLIVVVIHSRNFKNISEKVDK
jgi:hypothetical protein